MTTCESTVTAVDNVLTLRELSQRLGVREGTLRQWRLRGQGPVSFKVGVAVAYRLEDVETWEREQEEASA
jgi:predicted DNA-binding transcriptional regulator AlpA